MNQLRHLCIHGHFYQPPRENPWLEAVEQQESAHPFHDWNERITQECYGPNTAARISTWDGWILDIRNNFERISFNFGPTLLSWLEQHAPGVYEDIIEADRLSVLSRGGHGNAIAQAYNHTILPLGSERERHIQIAWGLEDFRDRFGRDPEGFWLPECAVDLRTLNVLASQGIRFTVLAPGQAHKFRLLGETSGWQSCDGGTIDPARPYVCSLPSGNSIVVFFYDGPISQAIAFEGLLNDGGGFARRLMEGFNGERTWPQILSIATDGESYGHHHRHGEMALAYALHLIEREGLAELTNFGEFLSREMPRAEVRLWEKSSWSCFHGVERWRDDCGCSSGMQPEWHQQWRQPVREALEFLAEEAEKIYTARAGELYSDPDQAMFEYIHVLLGAKLETFRRFHEQHQRPGGPEDRALEGLHLLETMRNVQLMFTSCAWFFDDVSGIETVQNLKYAARVIQLLHPWRPGLEEEFLNRLAEAPSNIPEIGNGANVYRRFVKPGVVDLHRVVAHHAITTFDREVGSYQRLFCYELRERDAFLAHSGTARLKLSRVGALSLVDGESLDSVACVLHFGGHDFRCSLTGPMGHSAYESLRDDLRMAFYKGSLTDLVRAIDEHFGRAYYNITHLFAEGRRELLQRITFDSFRRFDDSLTLIYEENRKLMDYLLEAGAPLPQAFLSSAEFVFRSRLLELLESFDVKDSIAEMRQIAEEAYRYRIRLSDPLLTRKFERVTEEVFDELALSCERPVLQVAEQLLEVIELLGVPINIWEAQNIAFSLLRRRPLPARLARQTVSPVALPPEAEPILRRLARRLRVSQERPSHHRPVSSDAVSLQRIAEEQHS